MLTEAAVQSRATPLDEAHEGGDLEELIRSLEIEVVYEGETLNECGSHLTECACVTDSTCCGCTSNPNCS